MPDWLVAVGPIARRSSTGPAAPQADDSSAGTPHMAWLRWTANAECTAVMQAPFGQQETNFNRRGAEAIGALVAGNELSAGCARLSSSAAAGHAMPDRGRLGARRTRGSGWQTRGMADAVACLPCRYRKRLLRAVPPAAGRQYM